MSKKSINANSHLTIEDRGIIEIGVKNGSTKTSIADTIGKDNSTVGKEIKQHRKLQYKCPMPLECMNYRKCKYDRNCTITCPDYSKFVCKRRDRSPGACNGCEKSSYCRFDKYYYYAGTAEREYQESLVDSRVGYNITTKEAQDLANIIRPLLRQGLSPYAILQAHPEIKISEKTLYTYIENGVFNCFSDASLRIGPTDLRRQVKRKLPKKKAAEYKKREDRKFLIGRTYKDYQVYMEEHPDVFVTQMDTVYNDETNGPFIQTFKFVCGGFIFALLHDKKTAAEMKSGVDQVETVLGPKIFRKYANVLLTDRGTEFSDADGMEVVEGNLRRTRVFYCDPMQSGQKGTLENNHVELRYILPKKVDLHALGLVSQDALNLVLSHVNSMPIEKFSGKSPFDVLEFMCPDLYKKMVAFGLKKIPVDELVLKPKLLASFRKNKKSDVVDLNEKAASDSNELSSETKADDVKSAKDPIAIKEPHSGGRKPKLFLISQEEISRLIATGLPPKEIAQKMGVSIATYYRRIAEIKSI